MDGHSSVQRAGVWDALMRAPRCSLSPGPDDSTEARGGSKLAGLLAELATVESLPTGALGARCDLDSRQVWGLLKAPRAAGQVQFDGKRWALAPDFPGRDVQRAVELLRARGWRVTPPNAEVTGLGRKDRR